MSLYHSIVLLIKTNLFHLTLDQIRDFFQTDMVVYKCLVEKLMYLSYKTWEDIAFIIRQLSCHNFDP